MMMRSITHRAGLTEPGSILRRSAYTLLELVIAVAASVFLIVGLASALFISGQALDDSNSPQTRQTESAAALQQIMNDLRHATSFTERTSTAITFTVPDQNGDEQEETIRYAWDGTAGTTLTREFNGSSPAVVAKNVQQFDLSYVTRTVTGTGFAQGVIGVEYHEFTEEKAGGVAVDEITLTKPPGTTTGDLLIAVVVVDRQNRTISPPAGWTQISHITDGARITMGVWWKNAGIAELTNHTFSWSSTRRSYGWMMRLSGHNSTAPIHVKADGIATSNSNSPPAPGVTTTINNSLILRIGGFDQDDVTVDSHGLTNHEYITMDYSGTHVSGGAGYASQSAAGSVASDNFALTANRRWLTVTIAIAPAGS